MSAGFVVGDTATPIGARLRVWRDGHGVTMAAAAALLGISTTYLRGFEAGELLPCDEEAERIGRAMDLDPPKSRYAAASPAASTAAPPVAAVTPGGGTEFEPAPPPTLTSDLFPTIVSAAACGVALARRMGGDFIQLQFAAGETLLIELPVAAARAMLRDAGELIAIHDDPRKFEGAGETSQTPPARLPPG